MQLKFPRNVGWFLLGFVALLVIAADVTTTMFDTTYFSSSNTSVSLKGSLTNWAKLATNQAAGGPAGGALSGTYPNPQVASGVNFTNANLVTPTIDGVQSSSLNGINVTMAPYSADPTGATDATTAIQTALNVAATAGGKTVYLPAGQYTISAGLHLSNNVTMLGDGFSTWIYQSTANSSGISLFKATNASVMNLRVSGVGPFSVAGRGGIILAGDTNGGCYQCIVRNCLIDDVGTTGLVCGQSSNCSLLGNTITNTAEHGLYLSASTNCVASGNIIVSAGQNGGTSTVVGIKVSNCFVCSVANNSVVNALTEGIILDLVSDMCSITGNSVSTSGARGIRSNATGANTIVGNTITKSTTESIRGTAAGSLSIVGNTISQSTGVPIYLDSTALPSSIIGNIISAASPYGISVGGTNHVLTANVVLSGSYGVEIRSGSTNIWLQNNRLGTATNYVDNGVSTIVSDGQNITKLSTTELSDSALTTPRTALTPLDAGTVLDFSSTNRYWSLSLTGNVTLATSNLTAGKHANVMVTGVATNATYTFPAWIFIGYKPTYLTANKHSDIYLKSTGTTDAAVWAYYGEEQ